MRNAGNGRCDERNGCQLGEHCSIYLWHANYLELQGGGGIVHRGANDAAGSLHRTDPRMAR